MSGVHQGRFAGVRTVKFVFPGGCTCPGTPHEDGDEVWVLTRISASAKARIGRAELEGAVRLDPLAAHRQTVLEGVARWNLLWPDPTAAADPEADPETIAAVPVPVNQSTVEMLDESLVPLAEWIDRLWSENDPNSAAPSRALRRGSGSRAPRKTQTRGT